MTMPALCFLISCLNEFMAATASELGYPQAAVELIRAGAPHLGVGRA